jgi:RND family efflux transporter MFP subunit
MNISTLRSTLAFTAGLMLMTTAPAAELIRISEQQMRNAGVQFAVVSPAAESGDGVKLAGSVVYPPARIEIISAPAAGVVQSLQVSSMDQLRSGSVLLRLHSPELLEWQRAYVQLATQLELAEKKAGRDESLFNEGIIASSRLQETRNQLVQARVAAQERAQVLKLAGMSDAAITTLASQHGLSPVVDVKTRISGSVLEILVTPGQRVEAGAPLAKVARNGELWLELQASRTQGDMIRVGDVVKLSQCAQSGRVTAVAPQMSAQNQFVSVRATLAGAEQCVRAGQYLEASVSSKAAPKGSWSLPATALVRNAGHDYVFVRDAAGVQAQAISIVSRGTEQLIVRGALAAGQQVAVQGLANLKGIWLGLGSATPGAN